MFSTGFHISMSLNQKGLVPGLICCFYFYTGAFSQTQISGRIKDTKGHPVPGASISVKNSFDGATSDSLGIYSFQQL